MPAENRGDRADFKARDVILRPSSAPLLKFRANVPILGFAQAVALSRCVFHLFVSDLAGELERVCPFAFLLWMKGGCDHE